MATALGNQPPGPRRAVANERGLAGLAVRILDFFGIDLAEKSAAASASISRKS
jgi:hypothetical protein